jgi:hypothetical protein
LRRQAPSNLEEQVFHEQQGGRAPLLEAAAVSDPEGGCICAHEVPQISSNGALKLVNLHKLKLTFSSQ